MTTSLPPLGSRTRARTPKTGPVSHRGLGLGRGGVVHGVRARGLSRGSARSRFILEGVAAVPPTRQCLPARYEEDCQVNTQRSLSFAAHTSGLALGAHLARRRVVGRLAPVTLAPGGRTRLLLERAASLLRLPTSPDRAPDEDPALPRYVARRVGLRPSPRRGDAPVRAPRIPGRGGTIVEWLVPRPAPLLFTDPSLLCHTLAHALHEPSRGPRCARGEGRRCDMSRDNPYPRGPWWRP